MKTATVEPRNDRVPLRLEKANKADLIERNADPVIPAPNDMARES